ncbi:alkaline shock response membrane anchor protein AmaP [Streptantibioticus ferralitis]|uniref:Alkaline shock response membrane anchor protein AmaP n=1 Tax=Streptantibioticus ferralitis TaxID=236510 RepID=A0ABT5YZK5_9ACTN|nr:alkaline shock response membrane anchor protein AmaP [Streptantibioticus ferralitis]MDF2256884.1 alkaline shock response membrane anchor protein AmaP [Streptantibioticus ferralitis]
MRTRVNRTLLFLIGLILLAVGCAVLIGGLDLPRHWGFSLPSWWPYRGPHDVLLSANARTRYRKDSWWWPVVIGVLAVLAVAALFWLLAQFRDRRLGQVLVHSDDDGDVVLRGRAMERALAADAAELPGVLGAEVLLTGGRTRPRAGVRLQLDRHARPAGVVSDLGGRVLAEARASTGLTEFPAVARLRVERHRARRVE